MLFTALPAVADGAPAGDQPTGESPPLDTAGDDPDGPPPTAPVDSTSTTVAPPEPELPDADEPVEPVVGVAADVGTRAAEDSTIRVRKAGDRLGGSRDLGASGLAGATFAAYRKGRSTTQVIPSGAPEATCVTDASGTCDLLVDSGSRRYLVVEQSAPAGWAVIDKIALGRYNGSGTDRPYRWNVEVRRRQVTQVPETEIVNSKTQTWRNRPDPAGALDRDDYRWANVRENPSLSVSECGLDVALLFDQSGSIGSNLGSVQKAATDFVDQLTGTPTRMALFTFSTNSPQDSGGALSGIAVVIVLLVWMRP